MPGTSAAAGRLPAELRAGPELMLAKSAARLPGAAALPGGTRYEPKMDGFRVAATLDEETVTLWSRQGKNLTRAFPEIAEALAEQVPPGYVLDGEVVRWDAAGRSSFDALQRRLVAGRRINQLVAEEPASFVVFDMLALAGIDIREQPYDTRRQLLERLAQAWAAPLSLIAMTDDPATAGEWAVELAPNGVEGIVAKGGTQPYRPGERGWVKHKARVTREFLAGAVTGTLTQPGDIILGAWQDGELRIVGRTAPVSRAAARSLTPFLREPESDHPWPDVLPSTAWDRFNPRSEKRVTLVEPITVEVSTDVAASESGSIRHVARFLRVRPEVDPATVTGEAPA
ncbi:ATP-dependent DNA ligase [Streptomyces sp. L7]|uniref:ATP-dependent DNA ligase n=1 Tax=Streptomyces sp. L7 TaxID=3423954 RepID=UPI003D9856F9